MNEGDGPEVSVVIAVHNRRSLLPGLFDRLTSLEPPPKGFEALLVDDRSTDGSREWIAGACGAMPGFRLLHSEGIGPAAARNRGIAAARGRYVAFTDDDALPERDWLVRALAALERTGARAIEGSIVPETDGPEDLSVRRIRNLDGGRYMTANMVYERALLEQLGGFDERFRPPPFLEDSDLAFRVLDAGHRIAFAPEVTVRHRDARVTPLDMLRSQGRLQWMPVLQRLHPARYHADLRPKVQLFPPGDIGLLTALALSWATRRQSAVHRALAGARLTLLVRRVLIAGGIRAAPSDARARWAAAILAGPFVRAFYVGKGYLRASPIGRSTMRSKAASN